MNLTEARERLYECIETMEDGNSVMSYAAIISNSSKGGYAVEYGTYEKKLGIFNQKFRDFFSDTDEKPTKESSGRLLQIIKERVRPLKAGTSVADEISVFKSGTLGILLSFEESSKVYGLTNMHVASSYHSKGENPNNPVTVDHQNIFQPSRKDRSALHYDKSYDIPIGVSVWKDFTPEIDAALIEINPCVDYVNGLFNCELPNLDALNYNRLDIDEVAHKQGRTTGYTNSEILSIEAAIRIENPFHKINKYGKYIVFRDQIMTKNMADPGDSGSVLISQDQIIGLTFADINFKGQNICQTKSNKDCDRGRTFHNKITNVFNEIRIINNKGEFYKPTLKNFHV